MTLQLGSCRFFFFNVWRDDAALWVTQLVCRWLRGVETLQDCLTWLGTPLLSLCLKRSDSRGSLILSSCWAWETPSSVKPIPGSTWINWGGPGSTIPRSRRSWEESGKAGRHSGLCIASTRMWAALHPTDWAKCEHISLELSVLKLLGYSISTYHQKLQHYSSNNKMTKCLKGHIKNSIEYIIDILNKYTINYI